MLEHKSVIEAEVKALDDTDDAPHGSFEVILSTPSIDLDGEQIVAKAFEPLPEWIPIDIDHGLTVKTLVGSGVPYYDGDVLKLKGTFASTPLGQEVRTLVNEGHLRAASIAMFKPERDMKSTPPRVLKGRLLNATLAPVGKNSDALMVSSKAYTDAEDAAREETKALIAEVLDEREKKAAEGNGRLFYSTDTGTMWTPVLPSTSSSITTSTVVARPDDIKAGARNSAKDIQRIQTMHDHAVDLGATCKAAEKSVVEGENVETKAVEADGSTDTPVEDGTTPPDETSDAATKAVAAEADLLELMRMELELL